MNWLKFKLYMSEIHPNMLIDNKIKKLIDVHTKFCKDYFKKYKSRDTGWEFYTITFLTKYNNELEHKLLENGVPAKFLYEFRQTRQYHITTLEEYVKTIYRSKIYTKSKEKDSILLSLVQNSEEIIIIDWESTLRSFSEKELIEMFLDN